MSRTPLPVEARSQPWARWVAMALLAVNLGMVAFSVGSLIAPGSELLPDRPSLILVLTVCCVFVAFPLVGTLVALRRPDNPIGWLFLAIGLLLTVGFFATEYAWRALLTGVALPGYVVVAWIGGWGFNLAIGLAFTWLPLLFPSGRRPGGRMRLVFRAATVVMVVGVGATAVMPRPLDAYGGRIENPLGGPTALGPALSLVEGLYVPVIATLGLVSVLSLVRRFRRAAPVERAQIKWFLLATTVFFTTLLAAASVQSEPLFTLAMLGAAAIPASAGIAILRYRLWDIDRVVSRTIGWAVITGLLVAVFVLTVIALQALLAGFTQGQTLAVAASTLVAFALFQPLRRRVQRTVDRRFDRARYDGEQTASAFADRLRGQANPDILEADLMSTVGAAVRPQALGIWIRSGSVR